MNILVAEDDEVTRFLLEELLVQWGHQVVVAEDGRQALQMLQQDDAPRLALLDWMMPGMSGPDVCRELRAGPQVQPIYALLLTAKSGTASIVAGLRSGADDYIVKPCEPDELQARINVGIRVVRMQQFLAERVRELEDALTQVRRLQGLVPICAWCKKGAQRSKLLATG